MISALVDLLAKYYVNNDLSNVEAIARTLQAAVPNDLVSLQFLGLVYYQKGRVKEAVSIFDKVVRRPNPAVPAEAGDAGAGLAGSDLSATVCYREATRTDRNLAKAWHDLGAVLLRLRKSELAISAFRSSLSAHPEATQALVASDNAVAGNPDLTVARNGFSALLELQPASNDALIGLGRTYRRRRDFAAARTCFGWVRKFRRNG